MSDMSDDKELMQAVLEPLLDDFQHWFQRSLDLLGTESIVGMTPEQQDALTEQVRTALAEVQAARLLYTGTNGQAGVEASKVMGWHRLVHACWSVAYHHRRQTPEAST